MKDCSFHHIYHIVGKIHIFKCDLWYASSKMVNSIRLVTLVLIECAYFTFSRSFSILSNWIHAHIRHPLLSFFMLSTSVWAHGKYLHIHLTNDNGNDYEPYLVCLVLFKYARLVRALFKYGSCPFTFHIENLITTCVQSKTCSTHTHSHSDDL